MPIVRDNKIKSKFELNRRLSQLERKSYYNKLILIKNLNYICKVYYTYMAINGK